MSASTARDHIRARTRAAELLAKAEDLVSAAGSGMSYDKGKVEAAVALAEIASAYAELAKVWK